MSKTLKGFQLCFWVTMGTWNRYSCRKCPYEVFVSGDNDVGTAALPGSTPFNLTGEPSLFAPKLSQLGRCATSGQPKPQ